MKRHFILSVISFFTFAIVSAASVEVKLSGLKSGDQAKLIITSESYLSTIPVTASGTYTFTNVPQGKHYVKAESTGYECSPAQIVEVDAQGNVAPSQAIKLALTPFNANDNEWSFHWSEDGSPAGYTTTSHVNKPSEIEFLGKMIVPADVPSSTILAQDYHIYLSEENESWTQEYAYRLVETLKTLPVYYAGRKYAVFRLVDSHMESDIKVDDQGDGYDVQISKDAFVYANPFLVNLDGVRGRLFSKRLHHALTNFVTDFGKDKYLAEQILSTRFGCKILNVDYETLTKDITNEDANHFQDFVPSELVAIINMLEELPEGFHVTPHLNYLIRRINGMPHPLYPNAAAVSWCVDNGYIEFMESAFGANNEDFETQRLILHEKTHFLWAYSFSEEIKNDWINVGGWYEDPNADDGWSTTKDAEFVSAYAHDNNPNEDMAESVAFYLKNPDKLMSRAPEKYDFICNRIMHGVRYISKIPDHLTFEVLNLYPDYDFPGKIKSVDVQVTGKPDEDKLVTITIELNDLEGYDDDAANALVRLYSPEFEMADGSAGSQLIDIWMHPVNGDGHLLRGSNVISKYSKSGHWTAGSFKVSDLQGNQRFEGQNDCVFDMYINNSLEDIEAPQYHGDLRYNVTDTVIEDHKAQNLEVRFKISDNVGFQRVLARMQFEGKEYSQDYDGYFDNATGEGIVNIPITEYFPTGYYYLVHVSLTDLAGNNRWYTFSDAQGDWPVQKVFITTPNPDNEHPEVDLDRITVFAEPTHPEAPDGETLVTISFYARDDKSGLGRCNYRLRDPQGIDHFEYYYHRNFYNRYFEGDPTVWEHYLIKVVLPQGSAPGIWGLTQLTVADKAFNEFVYNFVETLIFEPDDDMSKYELFSEIDDSILSFGLESSEGNTFSYNWRVIHEETGLELSGNQTNSAVNSRAAIDNRIDLSEMPSGDIVLIVKIFDEAGTPLSVKTKRMKYSNPAGLDEIAVDLNDNFDLYNLQGVAIAKNCSSSHLQNLTPGIYIIRQGEKVTKILIP